MWTSLCQFSYLVDPGFSVAYHFWVNWALMNSDKPSFLHLAAFLFSSRIFETLYHGFSFKENLLPDCETVNSLLGKPVGNKSNWKHLFFMYSVYISEYHISCSWECPQGQRSPFVYSNNQVNNMPQNGIPSYIVSFTSLAIHLPRKLPQIH